MVAFLQCNCNIHEPLNLFLKHCWLNMKITSVWLQHHDLKVSGYFSIISFPSNLLSELQNLTILFISIPYYTHNYKPVAQFRIQKGLKLTCAQDWSVIGKQTLANASAAILLKAVETMSKSSLTQLRKVTRMKHFGEIFYTSDYGKLKTCGYCVEYGEEGMFGLVQYFLYCPIIGDAVAVIKSLIQMDPAFLTLPLDDNCSCHIKGVAVDDEWVWVCCYKLTTFYYMLHCK